jgi:hypothetical protein
MNREGHNNTKFFIGPEVEHTPAFSKKTLFVVGEQDAATIEKIAREHKTPHIFLGANHSFNATITSSYWDKTITALLDRGFWVTLDYQAHEHELVLKMLNPGIWQSRQFVPLLGVRIPKVQTSSPNLTVKIDDIDFNATNPGVWCMHFHEVTDSNRFTDWQDYGTDVVITEEQTTSNATAPVYADINKPALNLDGIKQLIEKDRVVTHVEVEGDVTEDNLRVIEEAFNDTSLGLDPDGKSKLKPDPDAQEETKTNVVDSPASVIEAYTEGAKEDPLGKSAPKPKKVNTKK